MYSVIVYQHKTLDTFRVVAGEHTAHSDIESFTTRVYQGSDRQQAIDTAYANEELADIRAQIERFGVSLPLFAIGDLVKAKRPLPDFPSAEKIVDTRYRKNNGSREYAVVNGYPNNVSWRWYCANDLERA
jgi:hypothetical protein